MDQTYFTTATMLPASKKGALLPRPQGDGMDSETLKIRELAPGHGSLATPSRGRQNLASSPKTATVSKTEKPHYVPHEPVRGAVKPLSAGPAGTPSPERRRVSPKSVSRANLNAPVNVPQPDYKNKYNKQNYGQRFTGISQQQAAVKGIVKTINVPVYNAPGHLSHNTYKMIEEQQKLSTERQPPFDTISPEKMPADDVSINMTPTKSGGSTGEAHQGAVSLTMEEVLEEARQVEGDNRTVSMSDLEKLNDEINELRRELENQTKVNTDLKKLLVASMGDDLHLRVESLVQDKAHLAAEVGNYSKRLCQDYEDIDKLSIQADLWRSKFKASRMMSDQLTRQNTELTQNYQSAHLALQRLLHERQQMKEWLMQTHRFLAHVKTAFEPKYAARPARTGPQTLLSLAQANLHLADNVKFRLLGPLVAAEDGVGSDTVDALSPAEAYAFQVLSTPVPTNQEKPVGVPSTIPYSVKGIHARFHPAANHDNLTFNVCKRCKGEIQLV